MVRALLSPVKSEDYNPLSLIPSLLVILQLYLMYEAGYHWMTFGYTSCRPSIYSCYLEETSTDNTTWGSFNMGLNVKSGIEWSMGGIFFYFQMARIFIGFFVSLFFWKLFVLFRNRKMTFLTNHHPTETVTVLELSDKEQNQIDEIIMSVYLLIRFL